MLSIDNVVLASLVIATAWLIVRLRRRGARGRRLAVSGAAAFYGALLLITMTAHTGDIVSRLWIGTGYDGKPMAYGFRVYGLFLLAAVLMGCGGVVLRAALALGAGDDAARRAATFGAVATLAVVAPLVPIQPFFAIPLTGLGVLLVAVLWLVAPTRVASLAAG